MGTLRDDLSRDAERWCETHISWVFLHADHVYKVKKPVSMGFLDFGSREQRHQACLAELKLNRRLAPDVYLNVVPIKRIGGVHCIDEQGSGSGEVVDWAVKMKRLPDADNAEARLRRGQLGVREIDLMARKLVDFHSMARCDEQTGPFGEVELIGVNVRENIQQIEDTVGQFVSPELAREMGEWQLRFLQQNAPLFSARVAAGKIRDGHGDLKLEHFYLPEGLPEDPTQGELGGYQGVTIVDCIEFNHRFRYGDVASDLAFLSMDLCGHERVDLAERLLASYAKFSNDYDLYSLVDFYESYRAMVRAKIATFMAADRDLSLDARNHAKQTARRYFMLTLASERRPLTQPWLIVAGGLIASGKSTLADQLSTHLGGPVIASDRVRKFLLNQAPHAELHHAPFEGGYDETTSERVYGELFRRARVVLESGRPVILDASFRSQAARARVRALAEEYRVPFRFLECRADPELTLHRLDLRAQSAQVSDGRREIFEAFVARWEPVVELPPEQHLVVDTRRPLAENEAWLRETLPMWP